MAGGESPGGVLRDHLVRDAEGLGAWLTEARAGHDDAIHQFRVCARRFRIMSVLYGRLLEPREFAETLISLRNMERASARWRDLEVVGGVLAHVTSDECHGGLIRELRVQEGVERERALAALAAPELVRARHAACHVAREARMRDAAPDLRDHIAARAFGVLETGVRNDLDPHEIRTLAKVSLIAAHLARRESTWFQMIEPLQRIVDAYGHFHDLDVALGWVSLQSYSSREVADVLRSERDRALRASIEVHEAARMASRSAGVGA